MGRGGAGRGVRTGAGGWAWGKQSAGRGSLTPNNSGYVNRRVPPRGRRGPALILRRREGGRSGPSRHHSRGNDVLLTPCDEALHQRTQGSSTPSDCIGTRPRHFQPVRHVFPSARGCLPPLPGFLGSRKSLSRPQETPVTRHKRSLAALVSSGCLPPARGHAASWRTRHSQFYKLPPCREPPLAGRAAVGVRGGMWR